MPLVITCAGCRTQLRVRDEHAGRKFKCPGCQAVVTAAPPVRRPAPLADDEDDGRARAPRRDRAPARDEEDRTEARGRELHEWEQWADRHVRKYILWGLL